MLTLLCAIPMISLRNKGEYVVTAICVNFKDEPNIFGQEQCQGVSSIEGHSYRWSGAQMGAFLKLEKGQTVRMGWYVLEIRTTPFPTENLLEGADGVAWCSRLPLLLTRALLMTSSHS